MKTLRILIFGLLTTVTVCQAQITSPGWFNTTNSLPLVMATNFNPSKIQFAGQFITPLAQNVSSSPVAEVVTPQIQALANSLKNNPTNIFNYVHDNIRYILYFGSKKGANLTLLEKAETISTNAHC